MPLSINASLKPGGPVLSCAAYSPSAVGFARCTTGAGVLKCCCCGVCCCCVGRPVCCCCCCFCGGGLLYDDGVLCLSCGGGGAAGVPLRIAGPAPAAVAAPGCCGARFPPPPCNHCTEAPPLRPCCCCCCCRCACCVGSLLPPGVEFPSSTPRPSPPFHPIAAVRTYIRSNVPRSRNFLTAARIVAVRIRVGNTIVSSLLLLNFRDPKETSRRRSTPCTRAHRPVTHARMRRRFLRSVSPIDRVDVLDRTRARRRVGVKFTHFLD